MGGVGGEDRCKGLLRRVSAAAGLAAMIVLAAPATPHAQGFVADLSDHLIAITTGFAGTSVLLFGALDGPPADIAVVVRGPTEETVVRRKERVGPVWVNADSLRFADVPSFYSVAASRPLTELAAPDELRRHGLGAENLRLDPLVAEGHSAAEVGLFREALLRRKERNGLFTAEPGDVRFLGGSLFRTRLFFPANVPPGTYQVQILEFADGIVHGAQTNALVISKIGLEADIFEFATQRPVLYGLASIVIAVAAGWTASLVFRKP